MKHVSDPVNRMENIDGVKSILAYAFELLSWLRGYPKLSFKGKKECIQDNIASHRNLYAVRLAEGFS